jgi:hypothetical protein
LYKKVIPSICTKNAKSSIIKINSQLNLIEKIIVKLY